MNIFTLSEYFQVNPEKTKGFSSLEKAAELGGVSRRTVVNIRKEFRETGTFVSPQRPAKRGQYKPLDDFDLTAIRNKVQEFYTNKKQMPTLRRLHEELKRDIQYPGGREHLRLILRDLGFSWKRTSDNRTVVTEKPDVVAKRIAFYDKRKDLQDKGYTFVYLYRRDLAGHFLHSEEMPVL